ncbi:MAG: metallophosphoesterase [Clostridia bacterium]|nr:metallophosphoesterase [Clostridia bacterium]
MNLFTISDLHLSFGTDKPMNIFRGWDNHTERIKANWCRMIKDDDIVVLPGDLSWGLKIEETLEDFKFLDSLPGKKIILKGNHDLWWGTVTKLKEFFEKNDIKTIDILFNNAFSCGKYAIAGTRGWFLEEGNDKKVIDREAGRLEASISEAEKTGLEILVFLHYPPVYGDSVCTEITDVLKKHNIKRVFHGHIHGAGLNKAVKEYEGIEYKLVSCDCIDFTPFYII